MGASTVSVIKTLIVPAIISLIIFLLGRYLLYPLWQHYRYRYSHYLPLETIQSRTSSIRTRVQESIGSFVASAVWRPSVRARLEVAENGSDAGFDSEDGEELGEVDETNRRNRSRDDGVIDTTRRLSRDLEEGFMDDSDDEDARGRR
ncbi:hypothetical protein QBC34DRAFT_376002 [Podospora aff. communis PSN243]|uniref:Uncharacterized protein n=1 Tax=Podospora aff. communis PSN243 TaxID=3040156 RepID=A0AAV9H0N0_9PEZI|nr:hypothetical protein QBC34DRAFT_376002 [Podospora aff. communis PSN243]